MNMNSKILTALYLTIFTIMFLISCEELGIEVSDEFGKSPKDLWKGSYNGGSSGYFFGESFSDGDFTADFPYCDDFSVNITFFAPGVTNDSPIDDGRIYIRECSNDNSVDLNLSDTSLDVIIREGK